MGAGSSFCPFGPDKGPTGPFTIDAFFDPHGIGQQPYKFFQVDATFTALSTWPYYSLPSEVDQGNVTIGTVTHLRFPPSWFKPKTERAVFGTLKGGTGAEYLNRGVGGDAYSTAFQMRCNQSKAAALVAYLTGTARNNTFSLTAGTSAYVFDIDKNSSGTYNVCLISDTLDISHNRFNEFLLDLHLGYVK
jgi:hypothetical protein